MQREVAMVLSQTACAMIRMEAMKAANRESRRKTGEDKYKEADFDALVEKEYPIYWNAVIGMLNEAAAREGL